MKQAVPHDVTDALRAQGLAISDHYRVYELDGARVKVKTTSSPHGEHGAEQLIFTGSEIGEDGKALMRSDGKPAVCRHPHFLTLHAYGDLADEREVVRLVEMHRHDCVRTTLKAARQHRALQALTGVARAAPPAPAEIPPEAHRLRRAASAAFGELSRAEDPDAEAATAAPAAEPQAVRHPSGRRFLLFPGQVIHPEHGRAVHVTGKALAAARGLKVGQCVLYDPRRPGAYYVGLEPVYPLAADALGPAPTPDA